MSFDTQIELWHYILLRPATAFEWRRLALAKVGHPR
jgi:hypothetical protein